jgi:hypothetical protein
MPASTVQCLRVLRHILHHLPQPGDCEGLLHNGIPCTFTSCSRSQHHRQGVGLRLQGHALLTRHLGSDLPCPYVDYDAGWNEWYAAAYNLPKGQTVEDKFGAPFGAIHLRFLPLASAGSDGTCYTWCFLIVAVKLLIMGACL